MIEKDLKKQIYNINLPIFSKKEIKLERQEDQLMCEMNGIEIEICQILQTLIAANWESPSLQAVIQIKIAQRQKMKYELDQIWGFK